MAATGFDTANLIRLAGDLDAAGVKFRQQSRAVMARGLLQIKRQMQSEASHVQGSRIAASITYDVKPGFNGIIGEIGPDEDRSGAAGLAFFYFGNSHIRPMIPEPMGAVNREVPNMIRFFEQIANRI